MAQGEHLRLYLSQPLSNMWDFLKDLVAHIYLNISRLSFPEKWHKHIKEEGFRVGEIECSDNTGGVGYLEETLLEQSFFFLWCFLHIYSSNDSKACVSDGLVTIAARYGVVPVSADSMQASERRLPEQSVTSEALEGDGHPHAVVLTNHDAVTKGSWVRTPLELIRCGDQSKGFEIRRLHCDAQVCDDL